MNAHSKVGKAAKCIITRSYSEAMFLLQVALLSAFYDYARENSIFADNFSLRKFSPLHEIKRQSDGNSNGKQHG